MEDAEAQGGEGACEFGKCTDLLLPSFATLAGLSSSLALFCNGMVRRFLARRTLPDPDGGARLPGGTLGRVMLALLFSCGEQD